MKNTLVILKKILIGYCIFLILYQFSELVEFGIYAEIVFDSCIKISIYLTLIAILSIRKKWMWFGGLFFFSLGTYDLFYKDILTGIPRRICSGYAYFDFNYPFHRVPIFYGASLLIDAFSIATYCIFPLTVILFFTNFIRQYFSSVKKYPPQ